MLSFSWKLGPFGSHGRKTGRRPQTLLSGEHPQHELTLFLIEQECASEVLSSGESQTRSPLCPLFSAGAKCELQVGRAEGREGKVLNESPIIERKQR